MTDMARTYRELIQVHEQTAENTKMRALEEQQHSLQVRVTFRSATVAQKDSDRSLVKLWAIHRAAHALGHTLLSMCLHAQMEKRCSYRVC